MDKAEELEFLKRFIKEVMNLHDNIKQFTDDGTLQQRSEQNLKLENLKSPFQSHILG